MEETYERVLLWEGTIDEVDPKEFGMPLVYFKLTFNAGILRQGDSMLALESGAEFPGKAGKRFKLILELEA